MGLLWISLLPAPLTTQMKSEKRTHLTLWRNSIRGWVLAIFFFIWYHSRSCLPFHVTRTWVQFTDDHFSNFLWLGSVTHEDLDAMLMQSFVSPRRAIETTDWSSWSMRLKQNSMRWKNWARSDWHKSMWFKNWWHYHATACERLGIINENQSPVNNRQSHRIRPKKSTFLWQWICLNYGSQWPACSTAIETIQLIKIHRLSANF